MVLGLSLGRSGDFDPFAGEGFDVSCFYCVLPLYLRNALCLTCPFIAHGFDAPFALGILTNLHIKAFTPQEP